LIDSLVFTLVRTRNLNRPADFVVGFDCPVCSHAGCRSDSIYTRIKLCEKQFWSFIAWPFSWGLYTQRQTFIDSGDC